VYLHEVEVEVEDANDNNNCYGNEEIERLNNNRGDLAQQQQDDKET